jgi:SSS family solute:Na+ symporter
MSLLITYGSLAVFFAVVIWILHVAGRRDENFTDYAVGGRAFGAVYQASSFLNTWWPGTIFIAFAGLSAASGVVGFYALSYSLLTVLLMYAMSRRVWVWGSRFGLRTQSDLFALRFDSRHIRTVVAVIGIVSGFPWLVLGLQAMGVVLDRLSFGHISFNAAVVAGIVVLAVRQVWTIRMGMRGVVITDLFQGAVAYVGGTALIIGLIAWLVLARGASFAQLPDAYFTVPGATPGGPGPFYLFSLIFSGALGGWCWPGIFVRLYTANGVRSLKRSAFLGTPLSFLFYGLLTIMAMLAATMPAVRANPEGVWFTTAQAAMGAVGLALAGVIVFAATMGYTDGTIQSSGAQFANDIVGNYARLSDRRMVLVAKLGMVVYVLIAAVVATLKLPALYTLAVLSYQGIIQLAVPQFLGIFWRRGNKYGAFAGMLVGFGLAIVLEALWPTSLPWAGGLTSGIVALVVNLLIYVGCAYLVPTAERERGRVSRLFHSIWAPPASEPASTGVTPR